MMQTYRAIPSLTVLATLVWFSVSPVWAASAREEPIRSSTSLQRQEKIRDALAGLDLEPMNPNSDPEAALKSIGEIEIARLRGPILLGKTSRARMILGGAVMSLNLEPFSVRSSDFRVEVRGEGGSVKTLDPGPVPTVRGTIREIADSVVTGIVIDGGLEAMIQLPDETILWLEPVAKYQEGARQDLYVLSSCGLESKEGLREACGLVGTSGLVKGLQPIFSTSTGENCAALGGCVADVLIDTDSIVHAGMSAAQVQSTVEGLMALVIPRFEQAFNITHRISQIVLRPVEAQDPYADPSIDSQGALLAELSQQWPRGNQDLVHLFTGRRFGNIAGAAFVGGVCGYSGYGGMYSYSSGLQSGCGKAGIVIHELGHSWGSHHTGSGIMSKFPGDCNAPWTGASLTEIPARRDQVDGICLDLKDTEPPIPAFTFNCTDLSCSFDASGSTDNIGITSFVWNFGDSTNSAEMTPSHIYAGRGSYTVTLTVTDAAGLTSSQSQVVSVNRPKDAQVLSQSVPANMAAGQSYPVSVTLKNVGTLAWSPIGPQCNAYRWSSFNTFWNPTRAELPSVVAPGQQVTLNFTVTAPATPGTYSFQWRMVHECVEHFGDPSPNVQITVSAAQQPKGAQVLSQSVPASMTAGQSYPISVTLKNVGTLTWSPIGPQCNAYRWGSLNTHWNPPRAEFLSPVAPGQQVTLNFTVTAPTTPGTYNFQWRMVHECVEWFGDPSPNVVVSVTPG